LAVEASDKSGRTLDVAGKVGGWMKRAGFINVTEKPFKVPYGPWPKVGSGTVDRSARS